MYLDGERQQLEILADRLSGSIRTSQPLRIGRRGSSAAFTGMIDDVRVYARQLTPAEAAQLARDDVLRAILLVAPPQRTADQQAHLRDSFLAQHAPAEFRQAHAALLNLRKELQRLHASIPATLIMRESATPRETFLLARGQYDEPGKAVLPGVPAVLPPLAAGEAANRLGLARWLVHPSHPLTARVAVNRLWQHCFGTGLVKTSEDFGAQGEWPTHPQLLDWLAVEFMVSGWDTKNLLRQIVTSATYRQSSLATPAEIQLDPENRLLARGPRFRLDAEVLRDQALAVSGLLTERLGGPSVKPYQPAGLWEAVSYDGGNSYQHDHGAALYRRGLYTFWKRQSPPPAMLTFDAPTRETCTIRRPRTNTPLQALVLLNDLTFVEASRALAERLLERPGESTASNVHAAFRMVTGRTPTTDESRYLVEFHQQQLVEFRNNPASAVELLEIGESPRDPRLDPAEHAAWTTLASLLLNLDETLTKR
jgi:hypothetical protein